MNRKKLHLIGYDKKDFEVISSLLQDSVVPISEMYFKKNTNQFIITLSRYISKNGTENKVNKRVLSGVCFENVSNVIKKKFSSNISSNILNILTIKKNVDYVEILFSGGTCLKLFGTLILIRLDDLDKEWPTIFTPNHN